MMKVAGIDPGLAATGIGFVRGTGSRIEGFSFGVVRTKSDATLPSRLARIHSKILDVLQREKPDLLIVEDVFSLEKYPKSGIILGKVTGVLLLAGHMADVPVREVPVREAKQILTGNGNAGKGQLERAVRHTLKHDAPIRPDHAADALGLAIIGLYRHERISK